MAAISRTIAALAGTILLAIGWPVQPGRAASLDTGVIQVPHALSVTRARPSDIPTVYVVGQPDRSTKPVRLTKGLCLNGVRLTERLLSESVLILYPDETGKWGYYPGFDIFRGPQRVDGKWVDPRAVAEYDKWQYDPLEPAAVASPADMTVLLLHVRPMVDEIAFPEPIRYPRGAERPG